MKTKPVPTALAIIASTLVGCGPGSSPTAAVINRIDVTGPGLYVDEHGGTIVDAVVSASAGWLCIHADQDGGPGPVLGCGSVAAGETRNVPISLDLQGMTWQLHTALYVDGGTRGQLEIPDPDVPALSSTDAPLGFPERLVGDLGWMTVEDQPLGEGSTLTISSVYTAAPGLLVIHNGIGGPVVGWAPLQLGANRNVTVVVTFEGDLRPGAMLHMDGGTQDLYENFNIDPPVTTKNGEILVVNFTVADG